MTLTSSRINDEFKLIQDILALCPGFDQPFKLYPALELVVHQDGWIDATIKTCGVPTYFGARTREAAQIILRKFW